MPAAYGEIRGRPVGVRAGVMGCGGCRGIAEFGSPAGRGYEPVPSVGLFVIIGAPTYRARDFGNMIPERFGCISGRNNASLSLVGPKTNC